jgi:hypothetical protein
MHKALGSIPRVCNIQKTQNKQHLHSSDGREKRKEINRRNVLVLISAMLKNKKRIAKGTDSLKKVSL